MLTLQRIAQLSALGAAVLVCTPAFAKDRCPKAVSDAIAKAQPVGKMISCKAETENGKAQYEVRVSASDGRKLEIDVSPEGAILQTEEPVAVDSVPQTVREAFAAKFPGMTATRAEKQTSADGTVTFELAFTDATKRREATFAADGKYIEEE